MSFIARMDPMATNGIRTTIKDYANIMIVITELMFCVEKNSEIPFEMRYFF